MSHTSKVDNKLVVVVPIEVVMLNVDSKFVHVSDPTSTPFAVEDDSSSLSFFLHPLLPFMRLVLCPCSSRCRFSAAKMAADRAAVAEVLLDGPRRRDDAILTEVQHLENNYTRMLSLHSF